MSQDESHPSATETAPLATASKEELTVKLKQLEAVATQQYALKNYSSAAEAFSEAVEVQDAINGEMATDNADLLYLYGRCLYHVGVSKSDVLGGRVAQEEEPKRKKRKVVKDEKGEAVVDAHQAETEQRQPSIKEEPAPPSKPFFQITGDENWTDSEEEDDGDEEAEPEEQDDDLAIAYEILDTARILFKRKIDLLESGGTTDKPKPELRSLKERLADTYDLQAEIKLENEQFKDAVSDAQEALVYKLLLYPQESGIIAEAHYKLSIALDFASLPVQSSEGAEGDGQGDVDEDMRKQAAEEMEKAIMSCQARIKKGDASLSEQEGMKLESTKRDIADARDLVQDMKNRLVDLRTPLAGAASAVDDAIGGASIKGLLGELLGQTKADQLKTLAQATENANDLSGLIKKKKPKADLASITEAVLEGKGKRKLDAEPSNDQSEVKKVKFENA